MSAGMPVDGEDVSSLFAQLSIVVMLAAVGFYLGLSSTVGAAIAISWVAIIAASLFSPVGPRVTWVSPATQYLDELDEEVSE